MSASRSSLPGYLILFAGLCITTLLYWPGLYGGWLFDDYPNIVNNPGVQPQHANLGTLVAAALSSPASDFKRPLASLSFALNYLYTGLAPYWMKLTNLVIHLLNGLLVFQLTRSILRYVLASTADAATRPRVGGIAAVVACAWLLLPINLTSVLYVVQRMESLANLFVLLGLLGYVRGRQSMLSATAGSAGYRYPLGLTLCIAGVVACTVIGLGAKETAAMLPLYAFLTEWALFRFRHGDATGPHLPQREPKPDRWILALFSTLLLLPLIAGSAWLLPHVLNADVWSNRNYGLGTRLLSETRIVVDYAVWTIFPTAHALSFYHDDFAVSSGLLAPWTTLACVLLLAALIALLPWLRRKWPLVALGLAFFLGCQLLTGTVIPLELVYEHRNYFASYGLLLAVIPLLIPPQGEQYAKHSIAGCIAVALLTLWWANLTANTAYAWGDPLRLAQELAIRAPHSPRAQYELGRTYIIYSNYQPDSPYIEPAYTALEAAAALSNSSILPEQALIFMNARMQRDIPLKWWSSLIAKLKLRPAGVQDESSLGTLTQCMREGDCNISKDYMNQAFQAALRHPHPTARLISMYSDFAWNILDDHDKGLAMAREATVEAPNEPAYRITLVRMLMVEDKVDEANRQIEALQRLNIGGRIDDSIRSLKQLTQSGH